MLGIRLASLVNPFAQKRKMALERPGVAIADVRCPVYEDELRQIDVRTNLGVRVHTLEKEIFVTALNDKNRRKRSLTLK